MNEISQEQYNILIAKANKWDELSEAIGKLYEDDSEADLCDIGETAAIYLGYL